MLTGPAQFAPGSALKYTNTNYVIAGLIIEKPTGQLAADEIAKRIIVPLGLSDTSFPAAGDSGLRAPFAHGGDIDDFHSLMVKAFGSPAVSITLTQSPSETESLADDARAEVLNAVYCAA